MGEAATGVGTSDRPATQVRTLGADADAQRERLDELVNELNRRRRKLMDWRTQVRQHRVALSAALGGAVAIAAVAIALRQRRNRRKTGLTAQLAALTAKGEALRHALGRVIEDPTRLAPENPPPPAAPSSWTSLPAIVSLAAAVARIALPHIIAALAPPRRR